MPIEFSAIESDNVPVRGSPIPKTLYVGLVAELEQAIVRGSNNLAQREMDRSMSVQGMCFRSSFTHKCP
jgi:hypothetical protein